MQCVIKNAIKFKIKAQLQSECLTYYLITFQKYKCVAYSQEDFLFKIHHGTSRQLKTKSMLKYTHQNNCSFKQERLPFADSAQNHHKNIRTSNQNENFPKKKP
jgi:hypothetical protein